MKAGNKAADAESKEDIIFFLEDEDAIIRMFNELEIQRKGNLEKRLNDVSLNTGVIDKKYFTKFIEEKLHMSAND